MQGTITEQTTPGYTFGGAQVMFDIVTDAASGRQFIGYFDHNRDLVIKGRTVNPTGTDGPWTMKRIFEADYNDAGPGVKHSYKDEWDVHCWIKLGVDASGDLHVVADHHNTSIRYWRTSTPGDLSTLQRKTLLVDAGREDSVTYPEFYNKGGDMKYLVFRDGASGDGNLVAYKWNNTGKSWSLASKVISGAPTDESPYWNIVRDDSDVYHIVYNWRTGSGVETNHQLCYVYTSDFQNFYDVQGRTVGAPIGLGAPRPIVDDPATGITNNEYQFGVLGNHKFIAYSKQIPGSTSYAIFLAHSQADALGVWSGWSIQQLSAGQAGSSFSMGNMFPDNFLTVLSSSRLALDYWYADPGRPTKRIEFTPADWNAGPASHPAISCPAYEPSAAYQPGDSTTMPAGVAAKGFTTTDSRSNEQTNGVVGRGREASGPRTSALHYVAAWQGSRPAYFRATVGDSSVLAISGQAALDAEPNYPLRPIVVSKITY